MKKNLLAHARALVGCTQAELAEYCGAKSRWIRKLEQGEYKIKNITFEKGLKLAKKLEITPEELYEIGTIIDALG